LKLVDPLHHICDAGTVVSDLDIDVSVVTPARSPGITDDPVLDSICLAEADEYDSVIDVATRVAIVTFCQNSTLISTPAAISLHCDRQRPILKRLCNGERVGCDPV